MPGATPGSGWLRRGARQWARGAGIGDSQFSQRSVQPPESGRLPGAIVQSMAERTLVVKVTAGKDDPERCNQALTVAAAAVASGVPVSLWLTGEASWFALPDGCPDLSLPHAAPLPDLFAAVLGGGSVTLCTQCAARREITEDDVVEGVRIAGATTFVAEILADGAQALVY
jgi:predicted peroxiredoxin